MIKIPSFAHFPIDTIIASGVASPRAQGHEINKTVTKDDFVGSLNKTSYRFYVSETHAKYLDKLLMESWDVKEEDKKKIEVVYSYKKGKHPIAKKLLVNGQPYQKII